MNEYTAGEVQLHTFLTSPQAGGELCGGNNKYAKRHEGNYAT
jgi:hypothetical protein